MPTLATIDVPTAGVATRIVTAFTTQYAAQWTQAQIDTPGITGQQFAKRMLISYIKDVVKGAEATGAAETARLAAIAAVDSGVVPT